METREFSVGTRQQQEWGWLVVVDLFLSGIGAGLFTVALITGFVLGMVLGVILVLVGALFLFVELSHRQAAWRLFARPQSSWVSRGTIGILGFAILAFVHIVYLVIQPNGWTSLGAPWVAGPTWMMVLGIVAGAAALFVISYTGFFLGGMRAIPLWNSAYIPALFLVSALLGGLGVMCLFPLDWNVIPWVLPFIENLGLGLVVIELLLLLALIGLTHPETTRESVSLLTHGSLRYHFLIGVLGIGLIAPLIILALVRVAIVPMQLLPISGVLLVTGMFLSRYIITRAGIYSSPV